MGTIIGCIAMLFVATMFAWGLRIVGQNEFLVVKRFGKFKSVKTKGIRWLCAPGLVDTLAKLPHFGEVGNFSLQQIDLYSDPEDAKAEVDFIDGSAKIKASVWWRIDMPIGMPNEDKLEAAKRYAFWAADPVSRVRELMDDSVRSFFAGKTIDEGTKEKTRAAEVINAGEGDRIREALKEVGIFVDFNKKSLTISDVEPPEDIVKARSEALKGAKEAERSTKVGRGYAMAIQAIVEGSIPRDNKGNPTGSGISWQEAREIYERQRALEAYEKTGAKNTFISPGVGASVGMLLNTDNSTGDGGGGKGRKK